MGIRVDIGGFRYEAISFDVEEDATPLAAGDSTGGTGTLTVSLAAPDPDLPRTLGRATGWSRVLDYGEGILLDQQIRLVDSARGYTLGSVTGASWSYDGSTLSVTCRSRLQELNIFGVQASPYAGTLKGVFEYYLGLAGVSSDLAVDPAVASRPVVYPGWSGELWYHLKQIAAVQDCDISLVSGVILLRPIRSRIAARGRDIQRQRAFSEATLAQAIEIYKYGNRAITNAPVYPIGGWTPEVEVLNVNAGETAEYTLDLSASVSSIVAPVCREFVAEADVSSSVYTVVANDGLPVAPAMWAAKGGSLVVTINPDTTSLHVEITGARGLPLRSGKESASNFSIALGSDTSGNRYSTLRILGTGVAFSKEKRRIRTGVPASKTSTEVGVTIDNPYITTEDDLYRIGTRAARLYAGPVPTLSGTVTAVNRLGDAGSASYSSYADEQAAMPAYSGYPVPTYANVRTAYTSKGLTTYNVIEDYWTSQKASMFDNQVYGNVNGARVYDLTSRRWYRIRSATVGPGDISFNADDDHLYADIQERAGGSYASYQTAVSGLTYAQVERAGLIAW